MFETCYEAQQRVKFNGLNASFTRYDCFSLHNAGMTNQDAGSPYPQDPQLSGAQSASANADVRRVPADAVDTLANRDATAPADAAGKPLYAEQAPSPSTATATQQTVYSATGSVVRVEEVDAAASYVQNEQGGVLDSLKETLLSRTEGLRQRGEQLAHTAKLKMEVMSYSRDLESLYARLGRAYHHRKDAEILHLIEQEIRQLEADIALRERQLESQEVGAEVRAQRLKAERERNAMNLPDPTVPSPANSFSVEERAPRIPHHLETEHRDTFFGLDKGGVDKQATVAGGNAAFDTQIEPEDSVVSLEDLEKADNR